MYRLTLFDPDIQNAFLFLTLDHANVVTNYMIGYNVYSFEQLWASLALLYPDDYRIYINITFMESNSQHRHVRKMVKKIFFGHYLLLSYHRQSQRMLLLLIQQFINVFNQPQHIFRCLTVYYITRIIVFMHLLHRFIVGYLTVSQHE